jgi:pimeloyl-ACP methyl ester carboxylesterase
VLRIVRRRSMKWTCPALADAVAVLDKLEVGHTIVLGHSWGGHLALQLALAEPERVRAVVVIDGLGSVDDGGSPALGQELRRRLRPDAQARCKELDVRLAQPGPTDADALARLALLWPGYFADPANAPPIPPHIRLSMACNVATHASARQELRSGAFARRLNRLAAPVVVVVGEKSPMSVHLGEETARRVPPGELMVVPDAGHLPWYEQPGCVAQALERAASLS